MCDWSDVKRANPKAMCGRVFGILGEKNSEANKPMEEIVYKGRFVYAGNGVQVADGYNPNDRWSEISEPPFYHGFYEAGGRVSCAYST